MKKAVLILLFCVVGLVYVFGVYSFASLLLKSTERLYLIKEQRNVIYQARGKFKVYLYSSTRNTKITKQNIKYFRLITPNSKTELRIELTEIKVNKSFLNQKRNLFKITLEFNTPKLLADSDEFTTLQIIFITNQVLDLELGKIKIIQADKFNTQDVLFSFKKIEIEHSFFKTGTNFEVKFLSDFVSDIAEFYFSLFKECKYTVSRDNRQETTFFFTNSKLTIPVLEPLIIAEAKLDSGKKIIFQNCLKKDIRCDFEGVLDFENIKEKGWVNTYEL